MHPTTLDGLTPKQLAQAIGHFRYDAMREFLEELGVELAAQAKADELLSRKRLARVGLMASHSLEMAAMLIETAWAISKPFMKDEPSV